MNPYQLHSNPEELLYYNEAHIKVPKFAYEYAKYVIKRRFPAGEKAIATNAEVAYYYAEEVIKGRFPAGEKAIAKNAELSYYYARDVIKGRWPK